MKDYVEVKSAQLPPDAKLTAWDDEARILSGRIETIVRNAQQGLFLVIFVLALFLKPKLAFGFLLESLFLLWVASGCLLHSTFPLTCYPLYLYSSFRDSCR